MVNFNRFLSQCVKDKLHVLCIELDLCVKLSYLFHTGVKSNSIQNVCVLCAN